MLKIGDRVMAIGTVFYDEIPSDQSVTIMWDAVPGVYINDEDRKWDHDKRALTKIKISEPPRGSAVEYRGQVYVRTIHGWYSPINNKAYLHWDQFDDTVKVLFNAEEERDEE